MDIYTLIHSDHQKVKELLEEIDLVPAVHFASRFPVFEQMRQEVHLHNEAEAATFYAALEAHSETHDLVQRSRDEHEEVDRMLALLSGGTFSPAEWDKEFVRFREAFLHHAEEEESREFANAQALLSQEDAEKLAVAMRAYKQGCVAPRAAAQVQYAD